MSDVYDETTAMVLHEVENAISKAEWNLKGAEEGLRIASAVLESLKILHAKIELGLLKTMKP